jgi:hypothetical protein
MASHGLTIDSCIAFSNAELIDRLYATIEVVSDWNDDVSEALCFLTDEVIERFVPEEALAERTRSNLWADDLDAALHGLRRRQAARALRTSWDRPLDAGTPD